MEGYTCKYFDIQDWEITRIGDEYARIVRAYGRDAEDAILTEDDLNRLLDVYHYWKILLGCKNVQFSDMEWLLHNLHFDVAIELFCQYKLGTGQTLRWVFD